jgi:hypothetical protein
MDFAKVYAKKTSVIHISASQEEEYSFPQIVTSMITLEFLSV